MNRTLATIRGIIPYVKELRPLCGSVTAAILMQQLDYWFDRYPGGFYKFIEPSPKNDKYSKGDSWTEELGFSAEEFTSAFKRIGVKYKSRTEFEKQEDRLQGKMYCSYTDKRTGLTWYFRNHELIDEELNRILIKPQSLETDIPGLQKPTFPVYGNHGSRFTETDNPGIHTYTEITTETKTEITSDIEEGESSKKENSQLALIEDLSVPMGKTSKGSSRKPSLIPVDHALALIDVYNDNLVQGWSGVQRRVSTPKQKSLNRLYQRCDCDIELAKTMMKDGLQFAARAKQYDWVHKSGRDMAFVLCSPSKDRGGELWIVRWYEESQAFVQRAKSNQVSSTEIQSMMTREEVRARDLAMYAELQREMEENGY